MHYPPPHVPLVPPMPLTPNCTIHPAHLGTCTACPLTSLAQHHLAYLTCTLPVSLLTHSPCSCHPITPLTLSTLPILLTPPALLTFIVPTAQSSQSMPPPVPSHLRPSESAVIKSLYPQYKASLSCSPCLHCTDHPACAIHVTHSHCLYHPPYTPHPPLPSTVKADYMFGNGKEKQSVSRWVAISEGLVSFWCWKVSVWIRFFCFGWFF